MSRLSIELTTEQHNTLKAVAAMNGHSLKDYVLARVLPSLSLEAKALEELEACLATRLQDAKHGNTVASSAESIFKKTLGQQ
jgi:uncharacterized protein (DUF1778 family)